LAEIDSRKKCPPASCLENTLTLVRRRWAISARRVAMRCLGSAVTPSSNRYLVSAAARGTFRFHNPERPRGLIRTLPGQFDARYVCLQASRERRIGAQHSHCANRLLEAVQSCDQSPGFRARHGDATYIVRPFT
jgi:hypothetical protein